MSRLPLAVLALATCAFAQSESWPHNAGVGFKFSTVGAGVEVGAKVAPKLNLRTGFNFFQYGLTTQQQGMNFHGNLNLRSVETHADFFPFHNQFHISPGILFSSNHATASGGVPAGDHFTLNKHDFISAATDPVSATDAHQSGIIDKIVEGDLLAGAIAFARDLDAQGELTPRRTRDRDEKLGSAEANAPILAAARANAKKKQRNMMAPQAAIDAVEAATTLPFDEGIRRYGFHGLSYEYVLRELAAAAKGKRLIIAHLGNGSSLAAVKDGLPMDTSMGLTPTGGVMMGTRAGDLDPGLLIYLLREKRYDAARLERLVDFESGLLGVSEETSDMKALLAKRGSDARANQAIAMFCRSVCKEIGAFAAVLGGLDLLIFTGGIGEHAAPIREEICRDLGHLGVRLDAARNDAHADVISTSAGTCQVRVIATNEELMIARHTHDAVFGTAR